MQSSGAREHWQTIYREKDPGQVSWYQSSPARSLALIRACAPRRIIDVGAGASTLVDELLRAVAPSVASADPPADASADSARLSEICVVDISAAALEISRERVASDAELAARQARDPHSPRVRWIEDDVTQPITEIDPGWADVWHDRAVFHFLTTPDSQRGYATNLARILRPGGTAIISGFAPDGPTRCSGLEVRQHDGASIAAALNATEGAARDFAQNSALAGAQKPARSEEYSSSPLPLVELVREERETHRTPWGAEQAFVYAILRRRSL